MDGNHPVSVCHNNGQARWENAAPGSNDLQLISKSPPLRDMEPPSAEEPAPSDGKVSGKVSEKDASEGLAISRVRPVKKALGYGVSAVGRGIRDGRHAISDGGHALIDSDTFSAVGKGFRDGRHAITDRGHALIDSAGESMSSLGHAFLDAAGAAYDGDAGHEGQARSQEPHALSERDVAKVEQLLRRFAGAPADGGGDEARSAGDEALIGRRGAERFFAELLRYRGRLMTTDGWTV